MLAFILFALLFHYWLFVIVGFHYCLMFVMVLYQIGLRLSNEKLIKRVLYNQSINQSINQFIDERIKTTTDIVIKINAN